MHRFYTGILAKIVWSFWPLDCIDIKELSSFRADYENCFELFGGSFYICGTLWLKGLSHEIDFENFDENLQILALIRAVAGFRIFRRHL